MIHFAELINTLTNARNEDFRVRAVSRYFKSKNLSVSFNSAAGLLAGNNIPQTFTTRQLKLWAPSLLPELPEWLIDRSVVESGNIINAMALLLRSKESSTESLSLPETLEKLRKFQRADEHSIKQFLKNTLVRYSQAERLVILRIMTGTFKSPVSKMELLRGLARVFDIPEVVAALRWYYLEKKRSFEIHKLSEPIEAENELLPIEIRLPEIIERPDETLGEWNNWQAHGVKTGIPCQLVKHGKSVHFWLEGNKIITDLYPEIVQDIRLIPGDVVLSGHLTPKSANTSLSALEGFLNGKSDADRKAVFVIREAFIRQSGILKRRATEDIIGLGVSENLISEHSLRYSSWDELKTLHILCRDVGFEGILLRNKIRQEQTYLWMATSRRVKAVLMYVEIDRMSATDLKTMTFGMYRNGGLVPVAKVPAESAGLFSVEIISFVKTNTIQRFGPVRTVNPTLVYELNYEGVEHSVRKKAGFTLLSPSIFAKAGDDPKSADQVEVLTFKN